MIRNTAVVSVSLPQEFLLMLNQLAKQAAKTRSDIVRELLLGYYQNQCWNQLFSWGRQSKEKFKIQSEADILRLIND